MNASRRRKTGPKKGVRNGPPARKLPAMRVVSILVPGPLLPALVLFLPVFLTACGSGSAPAPTTPGPGSPAPAPPPVETVLAHACNVESVWRGASNFFLKTTATNIALSPDLFADLRPGERPSWNSVRLFYETGRAADVTFTFTEGRALFGSDSRRGTEPGPSLRSPDEYTITLRQGGTTAHLPFSGGDDDPHRLQASTTDSRWLTGLSRCATEEATDGCPLSWDMALVRHFDGGDPLANCPEAP